MQLCTGTRSKDSTDEFVAKFLKLHQTQNGIWEENSKAKRRKPNVQVAEESDDEDEKEGECEVLSEGAASEEEEMDDGDDE